MRMPKCTAAFQLCCPCACHSDFGHSSGLSTASGEAIVRVFAPRLWGPVWGLGLLHLRVLPSPRVWISLPYMAMGFDISARAGASKPACGVIDPQAFKCCSPGRMEASPMGSGDLIGGLKFCSFGFGHRLGYGYHYPIWPWGLTPLPELEHRGQLVGSHHHRLSNAVRLAGWRHRPWVMGT